MTSASPAFKKVDAWALVFLLLGIWIALVSVSAHAQDQSFGIWRNPKNSVHIRAEPCGQGMCGTVVWANEKAKSDARKGSDKPLLGSRLFQNFAREAPRVWRGKVFVPDIGKTFTGTVTIIDEQSI